MNTAPKVARGTASRMVAGERQCEASAERVAVDGGDHGLPEPVDLFEGRRHEFLCGERDGHRRGGRRL